jgi:hypothetical protein
MNDNHKLPAGVELSKDTTVFYPEGQWTFRRGELVWSRINGWKKYYEVPRQESHFKTAEEAKKAWLSSSH